MIKVIFSLLLLCHVAAVTAQPMVEAETYYENSYREWVIYTADEDIRGNLRMRWIHQDDWSAWDFTLGDVFATIDQKWADQPDMWVIRCDGVTVTARTAWAGDFHRWKLNDGNTQINWEARYAAQRDHWQTESDKKYGSFAMEMEWEEDPREWIITDALSGEVSDAMRIAMLFLSLHFSAPHR